jgi:iron complex outermembrane receptor protein
VTAFYFKLKETIVQQPSGRGSTVIFRNAGAADQFGIETAINWNILNHPKQFVQHLDWNIAYTYHHFKFKNYRKEGNNYSGNKLTGVAPHTVVSTINAKTKPGFYGMLSYNFTDKIPLNDANTVYSDAYHLMQAKVGLQRELAKNWQLDLFIGVDNVLNETYSLGNDLNAFGGRYYQPAAPRNWFSGAKIRIGI